MPEPDRTPLLKTTVVRGKKHLPAQPKLGGRKLPWLDGKSPSNNPSTHRKVPGAFVMDSDTNSLASNDSTSSSPMPKNAQKPLPRGDPIIRSIESTPSLRQKPTRASISRRVSRIGASHPSPAAKIVQSHVPPKMMPKTDNVVKEASYSASSSPPNVPKEPLNVKIPSSISSVISSTQTHDFPSNAERRRIDLTSVLAHLENKESLGGNPATYEQSSPLQMNAPKPSIQFSPTLISNSRDFFKPTKEDVQLSNAIEGLEDLVKEAVHIAENAADHDNLDEATEIIDNARIAMERASAVAVQHHMKSSSPLGVSESSPASYVTSSGSGSCAASDTCSRSSPHIVLRDGAPSAHVSKTSPLPSNEYFSQAKRGDVVIQINDQRRPDLDESSLSAPAKSSRGGHGGTYATDWAHPSSPRNVRDKRYAISSGSSDSSLSHPSQLSDDSTHPLSPRPVRAATRDHLEYVLRPTVPPQSSHDHSSRGRSSHNDDVGKRNRQRRDGYESLDEGSPRRHRGHRRFRDSHNDPLLDEDPRRRPTIRTRRGYRRTENELSVRDQVRNHTFSLHRHHHRQPIARNWSTFQKRITATIACMNTSLLGIIVGIYAGEVPRIQYALADEGHDVIIGNVALYLGIAISTFVTWPLPLLHGRKPYILAALALALPLQFPQALVVGTSRSPNKPGYETGLLLKRGVSGVVLGFANVNFLTVLLDLFGASLQSKNPHQELVVINDVRRHGGGMGLWLGIWSWCSIASLAIGFQLGAAIIEYQNPDWGFYIVVILLAAALFLNILAPETRRSAYRKHVTEVYDRDENFITRRVARGEIKLHISTEGPKYWFEEIWAGMKLTIMMMCQTGFAILALYLGWIYAQIVLVIVLLGALLSREYKWHPKYVGAGVMSIAIGALLAVPLTKAGLFSRDRKQGARTDSMTFERQVTWSSHLVRRCVFTLALPLMGLAYTVSSAGKPQPYMVPIAFSGAVAFFSILAIAECHGLIMETYDTCDLQPGVNTKHRLQSMAVQDRRRRTNYSSFPRVSAGIFASQTLAFIGAAAATEVGGIMTRHIGAQASTGVTAGILLALTILLTTVLWRFRQVQVIPNHAFGTRKDSKAWEDTMRAADWKPVIIGNPSGKMRKMSILELGSMSRWTEIRKLNNLIRPTAREESAVRKGLSWRN